MIVTFTDFGASGPYLGQMELAVRRVAPQVPVFHLMADAPAFDPFSSAYLLAALARDMPTGAVLLGVVDPGVGGERSPLVAKADGIWLVGPDNGLFEAMMRRCEDLAVWAIHWRPKRMSATFHGRDLFAPVAARLALGQTPAEIGCRPVPPPLHVDWPEDLGAVVYVDHYGNAWTGLRAASVPETAEIEVAGRRLSRRRTFGDVPAGQAFWYENSSGLVEIAVNGGRADSLDGVGPGAIVTIC